MLGQKDTAGVGGPFIAEMMAFQYPRIPESKQGSYRV